jgi:hypothetical protein
MQKPQRHELARQPEVGALWSILLLAFHDVVEKRFYLAQKTDPNWSAFLHQSKPDSFVYRASPSLLCQ